jgi:hypothetical protein
MPVYGLVVEGLSDHEALETIIRRLDTSSEVEVVTLLAGDKKRLMKNFAGLLERFRWSNQGSVVDKAFVIRDSNGEDPAGILAKMQATLATRSSYGFPVQPLVIVQALEAWFLADERAIQSLSAKKQTLIRDPEKVSGPKEVLKARLSASKVLYTHKVAQALAENISLEKVARRCPRFRLFADALMM